MLLCSLGLDCVAVYMYGSTLKHRTLASRPSDGVYTYTHEVAVIALRAKLHSALSSPKTKTTGSKQRNLADLTSK